MARLGRPRRSRCDRTFVPSYLVEAYLADSPAAIDDSRDRARAMDDEDAGVRYVRTTFLPEDEVVLHIFEAPSAEAVDAASRRAAFVHERIVEVVEESSDPARGWIT